MIFASSITSSMSSSRRFPSDDVRAPTSLVPARMITRDRCFTPPPTIDNNPKFGSSINSTMDAAVHPGNPLHLTIAVGDEQDDEDEDDEDDVVDRAAMRRFSSLSRWGPYGKSAFEGGDVPEVSESP